MSDKKDTATFHKDGYRRVKCPHCHKYVGRKAGKVLITCLDQKVSRNCRCCHCKKIFIVYPPVKTRNKKTGEKIIKWGPDLSYTTPDLTEGEIEDTINAED